MCARESLCVSVCMCAYVRERENLYMCVSMCVCVCVRERERDST